jgi:hypothetical protein
MNGSNFAKFFSLFLILTILNGCSYLTYQGKTATQKERIILKEGVEQKSVFTSYDLSVSYQYLRHDRHLTLSGVIEPADGLKYNFTHVEHFDFRVYFLDADSRILSYKELFGSKWKGAIETWKFTRSLVLPENTAAMVFGYSGKAIEGGYNGDATTWNFWLLP